jgi:hypothetical protein
MLCKNTSLACLIYFIFDEEPRILQKKMVASKKNGSFSIKKNDKQCENYWMKLEGFQNVVHNSWVSPTQRMDSTKKTYQQSSRT